MSDENTANVTNPENAAPATGANAASEANPAAAPNTDQQSAQPQVTIPSPEEVVNGFKNIFLAGIGALSIGADKSKDLINQLAARGEITVDQGKQLTEELANKAGTVAGNIHDDMLGAYIKSMKPEDRASFVQKVTDMATAADAASTPASASSHAAQAEVVAASVEVQEKAE